MTSAEMVVVGMKHIVCFSGGHSSAIAAVEVVRKFGAEDTILLNHDLCPRTEDADIKRFKKQVSDYLGVPITSTCVWKSRRLRLALSPPPFAPTD